MKLISCILLLCVYHFGYSQVHKYKAYQSCKTTPEVTHVSESDWTKVDILVVINLDKNKINTYGGQEGDYDILKIDDADSTKDNLTIQYSAIDENGEKIKIIVLKYFDHPGNLTMIFDYPSAEYAFRLKKDD